MEHWWNNVDKRKPRYSDKIEVKRRFFYANHFKLHYKTNLIVLKNSFLCTEAKRVIQFFKLTKGEYIFT
jgi:hypothetical protein